MLIKKLIRTAGRYKAQFISMIIMTALGMGMFLGFNMEWFSIEKNTTQFFEDTGYADYRIYSEEGFTEEDLKKVQNIEGVQNAARYLAINADLADTGKRLAVTMTENPEVSGFVLMQGQVYDAESEDGLWLYDKFAAQNGISIGDELELKYESITIKGTVKGLIESSEYLICVQDETQIMPDASSYGYVYISPKFLDSVISQTIKTEIKDEAKNLLGILYSEKSGEKLAESLYEQYYDEVNQKIYTQIHVLSDLDKTEFKEAVNEVFGETMVVLTKDETTSYSESQGEVQEGKTMGLILPVLFMLIAVLTMVTTMYRIASNEKTQIGTLKALGFKDRKILRHYSTYTLMIGIVGTALGIALGYLVGWYIMNPDGMMGTYFTMPQWTLYIPWWCWLVMVIMILLMLLIGRLSVKKMLKGTAADALRPYVPTMSKPLLLERTKLWDRLGFGTRWNLRDIMRHKVRSIVTLIGVMGCMLLMVASLGMRDTAQAFIRNTYVNNAGYNSKIFISGAASNEDALEIAKEYEGDYSASLSVQMNEETYALDIYHIEHDLIRFIGKDGSNVELPDDGALVCLRMQKEYGLKEGDQITVSLFGSDKEYTLTVAGADRSITEGIVISDAYAATLMCDKEALTESDSYVISAVYTGTLKEEIETGSIISSVQSKTDISSSMDSFMEIMETSIVVLILAAVGLGIIVLYNLGVMSYTERYRELATLKVVGFKNRKLKGLLIGQNMWITVAGILLGIAAGEAVFAYLVEALGSSYEMKGSISILSIIICVIITFAVSMLVSLMASGKSKKVDMVAALKTEE